LYSIVPFGGRSIILVGDLGQLPLILDRPAYACEGHAKELWNLFRIVVTLDTMFRKDMDKAMIKTFLTSANEC
jgi:hypothetical protein